MRAFTWFMVGVAVAFTVALIIGCARIPPKSMSWDQENLKSGDSRQGCAAKHGAPLEIDGLYVECF